MTGVDTPRKFLYMNSTHTATLAATYAYGPQQFGRTVAAGTTVALLKDPAKQDGELITFKHNGCTGVAHISALRNIKAL